MHCHLRPAPPRHQALRHQRDEDRREHVVDDGASDEVGEEEGSVGGVEGQVVDAAERVDEALEELLAPVHPRDRTQQHRRPLPLPVLLLHRHHQRPLHHL
eukprot:2827077-Rhodomonas_salina.1